MYILYSLSRFAVFDAVFAVQWFTNSPIVSCTLSPAMSGCSVAEPTEEPIREHSRRGTRQELGNQRSGRVYADIENRYTTVHH